jgi:hypothetical protein
MTTPLPARLRLLAAGLLLLAASATATAQADSCPPAERLADIAQTNRQAEALFRRRALMAIQPALAERPDGYARAATHGATGDGVTDDTRALQKALQADRHVWLDPGKVYRISRRLELGAGMALASNGTATVLLSAQGLDNAVALRTNATLYSEHGAGLMLTGDNVRLQGLFVVKEWVEDRYVVGIDVRQASNVVLLGLRLRGFSLAPGIVTVRSSDDVLVRDTLIHDSCTASETVPKDIASLQITAISVDDSRINERGSQRLTLINNVIENVRMVPRTYRGNQSDGINFAAVSTGTGSLIEGNFIEGVDEGLDLWGNGIRIIGNVISATGLTVKLIHGANHLEFARNEFIGGQRGNVGLYSAVPPEARRQVHDIQIHDNLLRAGPKINVLVDGKEPFAPTGIVLSNNRPALAQCGDAIARCPPGQCEAHNEQRLTLSGLQACAQAGR